MASKNSRDNKQVYEDLKEQLSKLSRSLKVLETRALKHNFSTSELTSKGRKTSSVKLLKTAKESDFRPLNKNVLDGLAKLVSALDTLTEIRKQRNSKESKIHGAAVGRRRKSKRSINFETIENDITNYKILISDISAEAETVDQVTKSGKISLEEGKITKSKEEKMRQEIAAISSRWNVLCKDAVDKCNSIEAFVLEMQTEYSKLDLWMNNAEIADSLLMEYDPYADHPEKLGTTITAVRLQLHENQKVLENFRKSKPRLHNMNDIAATLMKSGRLDEEDTDELERVINVIVAKWESIDNRLNASRDRIYAEINQLRKRLVKQRQSIIRRFSSRRNSSFRRKRSMRKKREAQQKKEVETKDQDANERKIDISMKETVTKRTSLDLTVSSDQNSKVDERIRVLSKKEIVTSSAALDLNASLDPVHVVVKIDNDSDEESLRLEKQSNAFKSFDSSFKYCERNEQSLEEESLQKFSVPETRREELEKQLNDITRFERDVEKSRSEFHSQVDKFEKAKEEDFFNDTDTEILGKRVEDLKNRWDQLWGEHINNKNRIIKATLDLNDKSLLKMSKEFNDIERQINRPEMYEDEWLSLEENILKQKRLMDDIGSYDSEIIEVNVSARSLLERGSIEKGKFEEVHKETDSLREKQKQLKKMCRENGDRLATDLLDFNQRNNKSPVAVEEETIQISDDYSMLAASLDDLLADDISDEGFAELDSTRSVLETKMRDFDGQVQSMNQWINDSEKLVNSLRVGMDPDEVSKRIQEMKIRCRDIEKKEAKVKYINKLGQEITAESLDTTLTDGVEEKLVTLNKKWRDTREILSDYHDKDEDEHSEFGSCCCFQMIKKAFQACFYS